MIYLTDNLSWFFSKADGCYYLDSLYEINADKVKKILQNEKVQIYMKSDFSYKMLQKVLQCKKIPVNHKKKLIKKFKTQDQLIFFHTTLIFYDDDILTKEAIQHLFKFSIAKLSIANTFII